MIRIKKQDVAVDKIFFNLLLKRVKLLYIAIFFLASCENENPAFRFSNFYNSPAKNIAKAIEREDLEAIKEEVLEKHIDVNFEDEEYEVSLLELSIANNKKDSFEQLLKLGANVNIENSSCVSPLISAIRYNYDCDLYFVKKLLDNDANLNPRFFEKCNDFTHDPICETIVCYNDEYKIQCGLEIIKVLTAKLNDPNLLYKYNTPEDYHENIVYNCLNTNKNLTALKFFIVDLKYKVPEEIFIDATVLPNHNGYKSMKEILQDKCFIFENLELEQAKKDILNYLRKTTN